MNQFTQRMLVGSAVLVFAVGMAALKASAEEAAAPAAAPAGSD